MKYDLFLGNAAPSQNVMLGYNLNVSDLSPEVTVSKSQSQFRESQSI